MDWNAEGSAELARLTAMQRKVLLADPTGNSKRVAKKLGISPHTVDGHFRDIIRRLGVADRQQAIIRAHPFGPPQWLSPQSEAVARDHDDGILSPSYELPGSRRTEGLRDVAVFNRGAWIADEAVPAGQAARVARRSPLRIIAQIVLIAVGLVILGSAALPLGQGFEALADLILSLRQD